MSTDENFEWIFNSSYASPDRPGTSHSFSAATCTSPNEWIFSKSGNTPTTPYNLRNRSTQKSSEKDKPNMRKRGRKSVVTPLDHQGLL